MALSQLTILLVLAGASSSSRGCSTSNPRLRAPAAVRLSNQRCRSCHGFPFLTRGRCAKCWICEGCSVEGKGFPEGQRNMHTYASRLNSCPGRLHSCPGRLHSCPSNLHGWPGRLNSCPSYLPRCRGLLHSRRERVYSCPDDLHARVIRRHPRPIDLYTCRGNLDTGPNDMNR